MPASTEAECIVEERMPEPGQLTALQLIENVCREDLKPLDLAHGFQLVMDRNGWPASRLARELHLKPLHGHAAPLISSPFPPSCNRR